MKKLRIALIMQGDLSWVGGMEYIRNIIFALASLPEMTRSTFEVSLLAGPGTDGAFLSSVRPHVKEIFIPDTARPTLLTALVRGLRRRISDDPLDEYRGILNAEDFDFFYPAAEGIGLVRGAAWIYDFQHKYLPEIFSSEEISARDRVFLRLAAAAPLVVLSSRAAETDFRRYFPEARARTEVLHFRSCCHARAYEGDPQEVQKKYHLPDRFFIICNQFWQHKNHMAVFRALELLNRRGIHAAVVCTGRIDDNRSPEYADLIQRSVHMMGLANQVFLLGLVPKDDQVQLLRRAIALIQPSLFEGWSTVVEDARCMGKPSVLSDFPVHLEQDLPNSRFFDRTSCESLAEAIADYWEKLPPGPDLSQEAAAAEVNRREVREFGDAFLAIAGRVSSLSK